MSNRDDPRDPTPPVDARARDRDRTLAAAHDLEAAISAPAPGREHAWRDKVLGALEALEFATADEEANAERPDSLLSDIARNEQRLRHRVHGLRTQYRHVRDRIGALEQELGAADSLEVADVRQRLTWVLDALRYHRAREADLIYEALDIADRDAKPPSTP
jgi:hypothetical protein